MTVYYVFILVGWCRQVEYMFISACSW